MTIDPILRNLVLQNVETLVEIAREISSDPNKLRSFVGTWGYEGNDVHSFVHGFLVGSVNQAAFDSFRLSIGRKTTLEERAELSQISKNKINEIREIISRLRHA